MSFNILSVRTLKREEAELYKEASALLATGFDRRELAKLLGLTGAFFFCPLISIRPARAFVPAALVALEVVGGRVAMGAVIAASISIANASAEAVRGLIGVKHIEPSGNIAASASTPVTIPPKSETTIFHKGFHARVEGENTYNAQSEVNELEENFEVFQ